MPASKVKKIGKLLRSTAKTAYAASGSGSPKTTAAEDAALKHYVSSSIDTFPSPSGNSLLDLLRPSGSSPGPHRELAAGGIHLDKPLAPVSQSDLKEELSSEITSILSKESDLDRVPDLTVDEKPLGYEVVMPWFNGILATSISLRRKEISRERKQKWVYKSSLVDHFERLVNMCGKKLGADTTINVFGKLGRETGAKEFTALMRLCIDEARKTKDEDTVLEQNYKAYQLFTTMREQGFEIKEETYSPFLVYLIDMGMVKEFFFFGDIIKDDNPDSLPIFGYYEMLLWISIGDEDKIQELCNSITDHDDGDKASLKENYLVALCKGNREKEVLLLLETIDITKVSSPDNLASIFISLGRLSLESYAKKFLIQLKIVDIGAEDLSSFIYKYAINMPKLSVRNS